MQFSRREFAYCSLGALSGLAGCGEFVGESAVTVTKIKGVNLDEQPHTVTVTLSENEEVVYQSEHDVTAESKRTGSSSFVTEEGLPDSSGRYELSVVLDNSTTERIDLASKDGGDRLRIIVDIDDHGEISFFTDRAAE